MLLFKYMIELKVDHHMPDKNPIEQNDSMKHQDGMESTFTNMKLVWNQHLLISKRYGINITSETMC